MTRFICERCGGTGNQPAGCWTGKSYNSSAGICEDCKGTGYLGEIESLKQENDVPIEEMKAALQTIQLWASADHTSDGAMRETLKAIKAKCEQILN